MLQSLLTSQAVTVSGLGTLPVRQKPISVLLPSPAEPPSPSKPKETQFVGGFRYEQAQAAYLRDRHPEHCAILSGRDDYGEDGLLFWKEPVKITLRYTKIPEGIQFSDQKLLTLDTMNRLTYWLCSLLLELKDKGLIHPRTSFNPLAKALEDLIELLIEAPFPIKQFRLHGLAVILLAYNLLDDAPKNYALAELNKYNKNTKEELSTALAKFQSLGTDRRFQSSDLEVYDFQPFFKVQDRFFEEFEECSQKNRFVIAELTLEVYWINKTENRAHANMLFFDLESRTVERFEPYGIMEDSYSHLLNKELEAFFRDELDLKYISPEQWCPRGVQSLQEAELEKGNVRGKIGGFCQAWSFWYADLRLSNSILTREQVIDLGIKKLQERPGTLTEYIIDYSRKYDQYLDQ